MILSSGKASGDLRKIDDKILLAEEKIFFNRYKTSYRNTLGCKNSINFEQALESEISAFNNWRNLYDERIRREELKKGKW